MSWIVFTYSFFDVWVKQPFSTQKLCGQWDTDLWVNDMGPKWRGGGKADMDANVATDVELMCQGEVDMVGDVAL